MSDTKSIYIPVLDSLRAFAALSVCAFHFICTTTDFIHNDIALSIFSPGKYGVHAFFVISGFVIPWAMYNAGFKLKDFFSFFLKRISRLEPPYLFSLALAISIILVKNWLHYAGSQHTVSVKQVALHIGYLIPFTADYKWLNVVYWTLAVEFQYYFFIALLFIPLIKANLIGRIVIYGGILALSFYFDDVNFLLNWLPVFLLGILLFLKFSAIISREEYYAVTLAVLVFCYFKFPLSLLFFAMIPVICILYFKDLKIKILDNLGKFSYSIYLVHPLIGASVINVLSHYSHSVIEKIGTILLGFLISIGFSWLTYLYIEKPSKKLSSSIKYKKTELN